MATIETKVDNLDKRFDKLEELITQGLDRKAGKWVETVLWSFGGVVGTAILLALLSLILIK